MKYCNWKNDGESLKRLFEESIRQNGKAQNVCIAREYRVGGCGMDMGFQLAYNLFHSVYEYGQKGISDMLGT